MARRKIGKKLYTQILKNIPIPCVDAVIVYDNKFLLGKRKNEPAKNKWWIFGGRVLKNETLEKALIRKVKEETNLRVGKFRILTAKETIFKTSHFGVSTHTVNIAFLVEPESIKDLRMDAQNTEFEWFSRIDRKWHRYVKEAVRLAGFE